MMSSDMRYTLRTVGTVSLCVVVVFALYKYMSKNVVKDVVSGGVSAVTGNSTATYKPSVSGSSGSSSNWVNDYEKIVDSTLEAVGFIVGLVDKFGNKKAYQDDVTRYARFL